MKRHGFTIVELVIVITIMGILLTLAVVNLNSSQANARDSERKSDAESIAVMLESFYRNASTQSSSSPGSYISKVYPHTSKVNTLSNFQSTFPDADTKVILAPNAPANQTTGLIAATNTGAPVTPAPSEAYDNYVYQPLRANGSLCTSFTETDPCRKFNLYYFQEVTGTVEVITSKNQ